jgi:hypothetical protein
MMRLFENSYIIKHRILRISERETTLTMKDKQSRDKNTGLGICNRFHLSRSIWHPIMKRGMRNMVCIMKFDLLKTVIGSYIQSINFLKLKTGSVFPISI